MIKKLQNTKNLICSKYGTHLFCSNCAPIFINVIKTNATKKPLVKLSNFKNSDRKWNSSKFNLQKTYEKIPVFEKLDVLDSGGNLEAGSYNIAIQYVDENLNATEWITVSNIVKIYNDLS